MKTILVATDFSVRSDRALRRAILLAKRFGAAVTLVHVVDDDQPASIVRAERQAAAALLSEQARSIEEVDGVAAAHEIVLGDPFAGIAAAAGRLTPDLVLIGPHRRQSLKDVFIGTTAERTIRASRRPVLMANAVPAGFYRHVLVAVDMSDCAADAVRAVADLGLEAHAAVSAVHVYDAPAAPLMSRMSTTGEALDDYRRQERERAAAELAAFLDPLPLATVSQVVEPNTVTAADVIGSVAADVAADLIVVGTRGRSGLAKVFLGSVAEQVLRTAEVDVLAVPPADAPTR